MMDEKPLQSLKFRHKKPTIGVLAGWQVHAGMPDSFLHQVFRGIHAAAQEMACNLLLAYGIGALRGWEIAKTDPLRRLSGGLRVCIIICDQDRKMRKYTWLNYFLVYFLWSIILLLGIWFLLLSRNTFLSVFTALYVRDSITRAWQIRSLEKFYVLGMGLAWLSMTILSEFYFRAVVHRVRLLFQRFALILGIELLLIFGADAILLLVQGLGIGTWSRWLILSAELVLGVVCLVFARSTSSESTHSIASGQDG